MAEETISFGPDRMGWISRWSYIPDDMAGLNSSFYTWKNGNLYQHDTNETRNSFYGVEYPSVLKMVFNKDPLNQKIFKTISQDTNSPWDTVIATDEGSGGIDSTYYVEKEGDWKGYIRRDSGEISNEALSTQGIGSLGTFATPVLTFGFSIGAPISTGDSLYILSGGVLTLVGEIESHTATTVTMVTPLINNPAPGDFIVLVKDSVVESFSQRGSHMVVTLTNNDTTDVELFSLSSEAEISSP